MLLYYQISLYIATTLSGIFLWKWNRYISVSYSVVFLLIPIINLAYMRVAVAEAYTEAILANGLVYLLSGFIQLGMMSYIFSFCKLKFPRFISVPLFIGNVAVGMIALTTNLNHLLYTESELVLENGVSHLVKSYGPAHTVYYAMVIIYLLIDVSVLVFSFTKKDVSKKNAIILCIIYVIDVMSFFIPRVFQIPVETQPMAYNLTQIVMLVLSDRLRMYSVEEMAIDSITQEGKIGYALFDKSRSYLGCSGPAVKYLPELGELYIDGPLNRGDPRFDLIHRWFDMTDINGRVSEFAMERNHVSYRITVTYVYFKGKKKGYQISVYDNTDERRYIELLQEDRRFAETVSQAKGDFLAHMSHEIRTPINAILGMDEMILRESGERQTLEYAEDIRKAGNTLLGLINDILDFSKIEAGKTELIPVDYQLSSVLNDLSNMIAPRAAEKDLEFVVKVDPSIPDTLHGDEIRIKQIITNLLTNAVKYTNEGTVTLSVEHERFDNFVYLKVSVRDTGAGIKQEDIDKLFIAFERIEEKRNRSIEGTGLGITIVQQLLALMDSRLEVDSVYGKGSNFRFVIKQEIVKDEPIGDYSKSLERAVDARGKYRESFNAPDAHILVVDDTEMNLVVFTNLLKKTRMQIDTAMSGDEAIKLAREKKYDIIFLDHRMPNKDGIETLAELKADADSLNRETPSVCITANAISGVREKYIAAGFSEYLTKPIDPARLESMIVAFLPEELVKPASDDGYSPAPAAAVSSAAQEQMDELLGIYLGKIQSGADEIEMLYNNADWANYTIKVHALKSTSRLVGETELADLAEKLEKAGDDGDLDLIHASTPTLLAMYRGVGEKYSAAASPRKDEAPKPEATEAMMYDAYDDLRAAVSDLDYDGLCGILDELNEYSFPDMHKELMKAINTAADNIDWGELKKLLGQ